MMRERHTPRLERSWEWLEFAAQLPSRPEPMPSTGTSVQLMSGRCLLRGGLLSNLTSAGIGVNIYDGTDTKGLFIGELSVPAGGFPSFDFDAVGVLMERGVFLTFNPGPPAGTMFVVPLWHYEHTPPGA